MMRLMIIRINTHTHTYIYWGRKGKGRRLCWWKQFVSKLGNQVTNYLHTLHLFTAQRFNLEGPGSNAAKVQIDCCHGILALLQIMSLIWQQSMLFEYGTANWILTHYLYFSLPGLFGNILPVSSHCCCLTTLSKFVNNINL